MAYRFTGQPSVYNAPGFALSEKNLPDLPFVNGLSVNTAAQIYVTPAPPAIDASLNSLAVNSITQTPTVFAQIGPNIYASLSFPIIQSIINCINQLIQTVIFFKNAAISLVENLAALAEGTIKAFTQLFASLEQDIAAEVNAILNTKIAF